MQPLLIILTITLYLGALLLISHFSSRGADNSTFFIGNRKMPWPLVALAMITAPISGVTFVSVPGMVAAKGFSYLQMCLGFIAGYLVIALVLVPIYYRNNIVSIYSFLENRFGKETYKTGAWFFIISKALSTAVKFLVVCLSLQLLVFDYFQLPFIVNVLVTISVIALYTLRGGVKTVIWADMFKSLCLVAAVVISLCVISSLVNIESGNFFSSIWNHPGSRIFFFDNPSEGTYFWKQFIGGLFLVVAMTGLDQDMMQHTLSCKNSKSSRRNLYVSSVLQVVVISLFLSLGLLFMIFAGEHNVALPEKSDEFFSLIAFHESMPLIVGIMFVLGLVASSYSSMGSALTSLTTSYTVDILDAPKKYEGEKLGKVRRKVHIVMSAVIVLIIMAFYHLNNSDAISAVFSLASYTYGPILGLFIFGIFFKKTVNPRYVAIICFIAPVLAWAIQWISANYWGYVIGYELLLLNAGIILTGLALLPSKELDYENTQTLPSA